MLRKKWLCLGLVLALIPNLGVACAGPEGGFIASSFGVFGWTNGSDGQTGEQKADNPVLINGQAFPPNLTALIGPDGKIHIDLSGVNFAGGTPPFHVEILNGGKQVFVGGPGDLVFDWTPSGPGTFVIRLVDSRGQWIQWTIVVGNGGGGGSPTGNPSAGTSLIASLTSPTNGQTFTAGFTVTFSLSVSGGKTPYQVAWHWHNGEIDFNNQLSTSRTLITTGGQLMGNIARVTSADGQVVDVPFGIRVN